MLIDSYRFETGCLDAGDFPAGNAASCPDVDALTDWTLSPGGASQASVFISGRGYVVQCTSGTTTANAGNRVALTGLTSAGTFDVYFDYRVSTYVSSTQRTASWTGATVSPDFTFETDGVWRTRMETVTLSSTALTIRFYATVASGASGNVIEMDNIRVIEQ